MVQGRRSGEAVSGSWVHVGNDGAIYTGACGAILYGPIAGHDEKVSELIVHCCLLLMGPDWPGSTTKAPTVGTGASELDCEVTEESSLVC